MMSMSKKQIECFRLEIGYERGLIPPFELTVNKGDFLVITGPNGAGKSTLIKTVLRMIPAVNGAIKFPAGKPVFGYVPQQKNITADHPLTAFEAVMMGRYGRKFFNSKDRNTSKALKSMKKTGTLHLKDQKFSSLSGGQKQRVLMARAIYSGPDIMVLDEPTQGMDCTGEKDIITILEKLNKTGMTVILISHQLNTVSRIKRRVIYIDGKGLKEENNDNF